MMDASFQSKLISGLRLQPRAYQLRVAAKAIRMFTGEFVNVSGQQGGAARSVLVESPTGSGKTAMGLMVARWLQQERALRVGWVAMRRHLLRQAQQENLQREFNVRMELISLFDKKPPKVDLLIVDEAQHDGAMSMANIHAAIQPAHVLGLSATPYRTDQIRLCFEAVIRDVGIRQLIDDGYLSRYTHYTIDEYTPTGVVDCYVADHDHWGKTLIFFHRMSDCLRCQALLWKRGIHCEVVSANSDQERQLADFESGRVVVLLSMSILAEGFDCDSLKTVFCRPSGKPCTIQMAGRVLRRHPDSPVKYIIQSRGTRYPFQRVAPPVAQFMQSGNVWQELRPNPDVEAASKKVLKALATAPADLPPFLTKRRGVSSVSRTRRWERPSV